MSTTKDLLQLADGFAAGDYTEDALQDMLGDDDLVSSVISVAGGLASTGVAVATTQTILDTEIVTSVTDTTDTTDDILDDIGDVMSDLNPFS